MITKLASLLLAAVLGIQVAAAQTPAPIVVPAASAPAGAPQNPAAATTGADTLNVALKALQELKRANDEILKKQAATLRRLDEIQKDAEQLKIYTKRG